MAFIGEIASFVLPLILLVTTMIFWNKEEAV